MIPYPKPAHILARAHIGLEFSSDRVRTILCRLI